MYPAHAELSDDTADYMVVWQNAGFPCMRHRWYAKLQVQLSHLVHISTRGSLSTEGR